eukprot:5034934-Alexandrium_andersonii.AAC.1
MPFWRPFGPKRGRSADKNNNLLQRKASFCTERPRFAPKGPSGRGQFRAFRRKARPSGAERGRSLQKAAFRPKRH